MKDGWTVRSSPCLYTGKARGKRMDLNFHTGMQINAAFPLVGVSGSFFGYNCIESFDPFVIFEHHKFAGMAETVAPQPYQLVGDQYACMYVLHKVQQQKPKRRTVNWRRERESTRRAVSSVGRRSGARDPERAQKIQAKKKKKQRGSSAPRGFSLSWFYSRNGACLVGSVNLSNFDAITMVPQFLWC